VIIAIDIGNTNITAGCFNGDDLPLVFRMSTNTAKTADEYAFNINSILNFNGIGREGITGAIISSVVPPLTGVFKSAVKLLSGINPFVVGAGIKTGLNILIEDPAALGSDMVSSAVGALSLYEPPLIIADMGTATKLTVIDKNGGFIGGAIIPGLAVSMNSLTQSASMLPKVPIEAPPKYICANTVDCMKSGAIFGTASMLDGMTARFEEQLGEKAYIVATGGLSGAVVRHCKREMVHEPNLILYGLRIIYIKNKRK
jgi:type III pantothenate kinase